MRGDGKKTSKRENFIKNIKIANDELTLEELDKITAGIPVEDTVKTNEER